MKINLSTFTIIVIEDNRYTRRLITDILKGFRVGKILEAVNADEVLGWPAKDLPDIVIIDWLMAPTTGLEFVKLVRAGATWIYAKTPIIMLTGQADRNHVIEARDAGVNGYIAKPVSVDAIMSHLLATIHASQPSAHAHA